MSAMNDLRGYLEMITQLRAGADPPLGMAYRSCEEYVLKNGHAYESQALTDDEHRIVRWAIARADWPATDCFHNARRLALKSRGELRYVEGYATSGIIPVQHAWCELGSKVIDVTWHPWQDDQLVLSKYVGMGLIEERAAYFGVVFEIDMLRNTPEGSLIDNWRERWPLLRAEASA